MNGLTVAFLLLLALPSTASAATLNELPFEPRPDRGFAGCLHPTGAPGKLAALGSYSRTQSATDLLMVTGEGADLGTRVEIGRLLGCAAAAEAPGGAAVVAGMARRDARRLHFELRATIREPGSTGFGAPVPLSDSGADPAVAIAPDGHAVVAWGERHTGRTRIVAARRAPGGGFGAPETLAAWRSGYYDEDGIRAAIDSSGRVTVLWSYEPESSDEGHVDVATAAPGAPFALQRLGTHAGFDASPVLAVAPDGWTLIAHDGEDDDDVPQVFERAAGADSFTAVDLPAPMPADERYGWSLDGAAIAVRSGGGAVIAWRTGPFESLSGVDAMTRETAGAFTARRVAKPLRKTVFDSADLGLDVASLFDPFAWPPMNFEQVGLRMALAPDGRILLAWPAPAGERPLTALATRAALGRLDGSFEAPRTIGPPLREPADIAPLFMDDGRAAVAWIDNAAVPGHGRLHLAVEGATAPAPPAPPRLTLRAKRFQRLFPAQSVRVAARCATACDLRATVLGPQGSNDDVVGTRLRGGAFALRPGAVDGIDPGKPRMVRVVVHASAPGGHTTTARSLRVRVAHRPSPPVRDPLDLLARRRGSAIVVSWRTAAPARRQTFFAYGHEGRRSDADLGAVALRHGRGRQRFRVRMRPADPDRVRWVSVLAEGYDDFGVDGAIATVRIRG